ncbi:MAG: aminoacyl-histidine dipeptidase [Melioribacteraceae bacterium]|nr:aminoacyl-histidine dipeptidase [Melioribacteraceae bacterium]
MSQNSVTGLKPELVWKYFAEMSTVPRPSKKEGKIVEWAKKFALDNGFEVIGDEVKNLLIKVPASKGYESKQTIVLQGHVDMVCEKNKGTEHDFDKDPIVLLKEDGWITADGTTLGADNGIGVAAAMAVATDPECIHGPIELLLTVDEETGLTGASNLKPDFVSGKILINTDSEEDGIFYVGCSGGQDTVGIFDIQYSDSRPDLLPYELMVSGLKGGHSGMEIDRGRANAIKLLGALLHELGNFYFKVSVIKGGSKRNAIPREAEAVLLINEEDIGDIENSIKVFVDEVLSEYKNSDGGLKITLRKLDGPAPKPMRRKFTSTLIDVILAMPNGVISMSKDIPGLVETSTNLATIVMERDIIRVGTSQRSSLEHAKENITNSVAAIFELAEAEVLVTDGYPGWQPNLDSPALSAAKKVYLNLFGDEPEVKAVHAGLECGLFAKRYPGLDMISFGPTITGAHSPDEKVNIADVEKFYTLLKGILKEFAK